MGGGGGGMLRTVGRVGTSAGVTNLQEPISSSSSNSTTTSPTSPTAKSRPNQHKNNCGSQLSLSAAVSSTFSSHDVPVCANSGMPSWPYFGGGGAGSCCDEYEWVSVDGSLCTKSNGYFVDDLVLGSVPSLDEVNTAVSALQQVFDPTSYSGLVRDKFASNLDKDGELDWMEPSLHLSNPRMLQPCGYDRVYDTFHLLQTEPTVQRMVISLSSDKAVWNAVLNNEVVQDLKKSFYAGKQNNGSESSDESLEDSNPAINVIRWIFDNTKAKVMEVIEKISYVVYELFKPPDEGKAATGATTAGGSDPFEEKLRTSFLLSIVVLLVVVVTRASRA